MSTRHLKFLILLLAVAGLAWFRPATVNSANTADASIRFGRDVLPILAANCFSCHGPDEGNRKAGLRLDLEESAKAPRRAGTPIKPGDPAASLIMARITSADPDLVMPPASAHRKISPAQIELLRRWIAAGAPWGRHWSFEPVVAPPLARGATHPIDHLVDQALAGKGLPRRPAATPHTLVRRLWLDLIGLPPPPEVADRFAVDPSPQAWERMVDDLLARPQFGEHWARMWLDLARYADTKGYEKDLGRTIWPYRDWVIKAINADLPLDRFTTEQLAGDLLPDPDQSQIIATAYHRNTMTNDEGGTDNEEFRVAAVKDRVDTTMQIWMGLTMGCAKCHTHKYDPISHEEYYRFLAIFNQTEDADRADDAPTLEMLTPREKERRTELKAKIENLEKGLPPLDRPVDTPGWRTVPISAVVSRGKATIKIEPDHLVSVSGANPPEETLEITATLPVGTHTALRLEALPEKQSSGQLTLGRNNTTGNLVVSEWRATIDDRPVVFARARADYSEADGDIARAIDGQESTGWSIKSRGREPHTAVFDFAQPIQINGRGGPTTIRLTVSHQNGDSSSLRRFRLLTTDLEPAKIVLPAWTPELRRTIDALAEAYDDLQKFNDRVVKLPIMRELATDKQRVTKIHLRGNFLEPGEVVTPAVPAAFHPFPADAPRNRLGLARWLVHPDNPLTPRVWANRIWARLFGTGIVETEEDFGAQGSAPSNPQLLDWLATTYRDQGWSMKRLVRTIVLSQTYRQASEVTPNLAQADPRNLLLSRGARYRLSAETIRDQALSIAGLLSSRTGGPPVMPPQPAGLWRSTYNGQKWVDAEGEDRYRRAIYTYLKRTTPYPSMITFDGGSGEVCQIRRIRTNTPLQALVTLNDPVFLEAAAALARRMIREADGGDEPRAAYGLRLALVRKLEPGEAAPLVTLYRDSVKMFEAAPEKAAELLKVARVDAGADSVASGERISLAAWIVVANTILNLDEVLTRH